MAERKRDSQNLLTDAESTSASEGHLVPASSGTDSEDATGTGEDSSDAPITQAQSESLRTEPQRTEVIPSGSLRSAEGERFMTPTRVAQEAARRARPSSRRVRRTLRHIDPVSVLKLSLFYYTCFVVLWLLFVAVVYGVVFSTGLVDRMERLGLAFVLWERIDISLWFVERWALLIGLTCAVLASLVNVFLAFLYNFASDVVGGAEMTFVDRDV